jgi:hypothetical protein
MLEIPADGISRALIPVRTFFGLLSGEDIDKATAKRVEMINALNVPMQRRRVELRQQEDAIDV